MTWVVASLLTARPSVDPTVHTDALALANSQQPEPNTPSRYPDLVEAFTDLDAAMDRVANDVVRAEGYHGTGVRMVDFATVRFPPDPTGPEFDTEIADAEDARRAVDVILERNLFDEVFSVLRSPNLANDYPTSHDAAGNLLPMYEWTLDELSLFREQTMTVVGCARVLAERGETGAAAALIEGISPVPGVLTRHITLVEHLVGYAIGAAIAQEIEFIAQSPGLTPETIATLRRANERLANIGSLETAIKGEAIFLRDYHYRTHTVGGRYIPSAGEDLSGSWGSTPGGNTIVIKLQDVTGYLAVRRDASLAKADEFHDMMRRAINEPDPATRDSILDDYGRQVDSLSPRFGLLQMVMPAMARIVTNAAEYQAQSTALGILLAMAEHRLDHGEWPTSLDDLVPDYLDAIPINPVTGDPFEYDHEPGQPPSLERLGIED